MCRSRLEASELRKSGAKVCGVASLSMPAAATALTALHPLLVVYMMAPSVASSRIDRQTRCGNTYCKRIEEVQPTVLERKRVQATYTPAATGQVALW